MAAPAAPSIIGQAAITPVTRKATTMPGSTTWLIASPISACRRRSRKLPGSAQAMAAKVPISSGVQRQGDKFGTHHVGTSARRADAAVELGDLVRGQQRLRSGSARRSGRRRLRGRDRRARLSQRRSSRSALGGLGAAAVGGDAIGRGSARAAQQAQGQALVDRLALAPAPAGPGAGARRRWNRRWRSSAASTPRAGAKQQRDGKEAEGRPAR